MPYQTKKPFNSFTHQIRRHRDPNTVLIHFDPRTMAELQEIAKQLKTNPADVIKKAFYLFRLAQGRTVQFRQKHSSTTLTVDEFEQTEKVIK